DIPSSGAVVAVDVGKGIEAGGGCDERADGRRRNEAARRRRLRAGRQRARIVDVAGERRLDLLIIDTHADGEIVGSPPRQRRIDIDRLYVGLDRLIAAEPAAVPFGLESE